jgi:hypothetical protein
MLARGIFKSSKVCDVNRYLILKILVSGYMCVYHSIQPALSVPFLFNIRQDKNSKIKRPLQPNATRTQCPESLNEIIAVRGIMQD